MNYKLLGCFLLSVVNLSVADPALYQVHQKPRFYGVKEGANVGLICSASDLTLDKQLTWYKIETYEEDKVYNSDMDQVFASSRVSEKKIQNMRGQLLIANAEITDSGIYYCKIGNIWGPGTALQVFRRSSPEVVEKRNYMKDMIIFFQSFLLMLCVIVPLVWYYRLERKEDAVYEEPEHDHTYEGLAIEHCGDLYEDLTAFAQSPDADASWEIESPEQE